MPYSAESHYLFYFFHQWDSLEWPLQRILKTNCWTIEKSSQNIRTCLRFQNANAIDRVVFHVGILYSFFHSMSIYIFNAFAVNSTFVFVPKGFHVPETIRHHTMQVYLSDRIVGLTYHWNRIGPNISFKAQHYTRIIWSSIVCMHIYLINPKQRTSNSM